MQAAGEPTFETFAARERAALVAYAWTLTGSISEAEELAQDALTAAWSAWNRVGGFDQPRSWARRVVSNRASTRRRRAGREGRALARLTGRRQDDTLDLPEPDQELWDRVRALPARQAQVVALHYLEDRSVEDIAEILDCAVGTVKSHLHRARIALAQSLTNPIEEGLR